jgi:hypothetical protein
LDYLTTHTSQSPIWLGFAPGFVNYKKRCTRLAAASDKVYQLHAHGHWFSSGTPASSTTKTCCHDIAEILLKVALNSINHQSNLVWFFFMVLNNTFNNISVISWWSVLLVEDTGGHGENHRPVASH